MRCPLCDVGLKATGHRGVSVNYCPLCGGTWLAAGCLESLSSQPKPVLRSRVLLRYPALLVALAGAALAGIVLTIAAITDPW